MHKLLLLIGLMFLFAACANTAPPSRELPEQPSELPLGIVDLCENSNVEVSWIIPQETIRVANPSGCTYINFTVTLRSDDELLTTWDGSLMPYRQQINLIPEHQTILTVLDFLDDFGKVPPNPDIDYDVYAGR